ncbi:MAG: hypothetical protein PVG86_10670 [Desulfobacterales bacterium]|jgi:hypothetical protein
MQSPHTEFLSFVLHLNELTPIYQLMYDRPIIPGTYQEVAHSIFTNWMHGGDCQKIYFDIARKGKIIMTSSVYRSEPFEFVFNIPQDLTMKK